MKNKMIGIYCIECLGNNKRYVGSSVNIFMRFSDHKKALKNNRHFNSYLQNAWNKYKEDKFVFYVLEILLSNRLLYKRELFWINKLNTWVRNGFNVEQPLKKIVS